MLKGIKRMLSITEKWKLPPVPCNVEQIIVSRYGGSEADFVFLMLSGLFILFFDGAVINFMYESWDGGFTLMACAVFALIPVVMIGLYCTRRTLIFYPGGLVYRDLRGETFYITDDEVMYVWSMSGLGSSVFRIWIKDRYIEWGSTALNYDEMEEYALKRYPDKESYKRQNKGE